MVLKKDIQGGKYYRCKLSGKTVLGIIHKETVLPTAEESKKGKKPKEVETPAFVMWNDLEHKYQTTKAADNQLEEI
jgi:hypothetical protein